MQKREFIGSFWVDTASVAMADPCRLFVDGRGHGTAEIPTYDRVGELWREQGEPYMWPPGARSEWQTRMIQEPRHVTLPGGVGFVFRTVANCDGWVWCYAERNADGEIARLIIDLSTKTTKGPA